MPGPLVAFFILIGFGGFLSLNDPQAKLWSGVDPSAHTDHGKRSSVEYYLTTSVPWMAVAAPDSYGRERCLVTLTAWATLGRRMRLVLDGEEQMLDSSWSIDRELKPTGKAAVFEAAFLDPLGGAVVAVRQVTVRCIQSIEPVRDQALYDERGLRGYEPPPCTCEVKQ